MAVFPEPSSVEDKCRILLQVSQAANGELELAAVLEAVAGALKPFVPVDAVAVVTVEHDLLRPHVPFMGSGVAFVGRSGRAYVSQNLEVEKTFPEDERLSSYGIRAYVRAPLFVRERLIGSITFSRLQPRPFQSEEVGLLEDVSRPIALAVANSLAYEEIRKLRDQLHAENLVLREEIDQQSMFEEIVGSSPALSAVLARVEKVPPPIRPC